MLYSPLVRSRRQLARGVIREGTNGAHPLLAQRILTSDQVGKAIGWPTQRARRWLLRTGAGEKRGTRVQTTIMKLLAMWPEAYSSVQQAGLCDD